jgi:phage anti-repressor protein
MEEFLKKYSDVPHEFITKFFSIAQEQYYEYDTIIDFKDVYEWFNMRKDNLKKILVRHFENKFDYTITEYKKPTSVSSVTEEIIKITPNCFKELCMFTDNNVAKQARRYFLTLEKLIKKYNYMIKNELNKKIHMLQHNQKPKIDSTKGIFYVFRANNDSISIDKIHQAFNDELITLLKLGHSYKPKKRQNTYNSGNANDIEILFAMEFDNLNTVEECVKVVLKKYQYRKRKEIYETNLKTIQRAAIECDKLIRGFSDNYSQKEFDKKMNNIKTGGGRLFIAFRKY